MKNKNINIYITICVLFLVAASIVVCLMKTDSPVFVPKHLKNDAKLENANCLKCHGTRHYEMVKPTNTKKVIYGKMPNEFIIDTNLYYSSSHWNFKCTDCHSEDYETAPHDPNLRFESMSNCIDCHNEDGDTTWSKFGFSTIETEYMKSVHNTKKGKKFNCWDCHNPHATTMCLRNDTMPFSQVVKISNGMCTKCHAVTNDKMIKAHDKFPHSEVHLVRNRCIDCHTKTNDTILVAHNVMDAKQATKNCSNCHSSGSKLVKDFYSKRKNGTCTMFGQVCKRKPNSIRTLGIYRNNGITISIVSIFSILLLVIIGHVVWSLIKKRNEN